MKPDTIAAQATPPGQGGIGIIRIAGPDAVVIASQLTGKDSFKTRTAVFTKFYDAEEYHQDYERKHP